MRGFLRLENLSYSWPGGELLINQVNLDIGQGSTIALMGANGSGKTTLGKLLMGLLQPSGGQIYLAGRLLSSYPLAERGMLVGYVFQNPEKQLFAATVAEDIALPLRYRGRPELQISEKVAQMQELFELEHCGNQFPFNLSHGEKQRLALAGVMAMEPHFIILDEPSSGLDWLRKQKLASILSLLAEQGIGYLLISHDPQFCRDLCKRTLTLRGGKLYED